LCVVYRDFAFTWQNVPAFPGRDVVAVASGLYLIAVSAALLFRSTAAVASRALMPYLLAWQGLKVPALFAAPGLEAVSLGFGEIAMLLAGGLVLFARLSQLENAGAFFRPFTGERGVRLARLVFGAAVLPVGLAHIVYAQITASMVPSWLPFHLGFAYLTGVG